MAVWQWDIWLVPKNEVLKHFSIIPKYMDLDWFESIDWWNTTSQKQIRDFFDSVLPYDHKSQLSESWGKDDETCSTLMIENGKITHLFIRIDVRKLERSFLDSLLRFAKENNFLFFTLESNRFIEPKGSTFFECLQESKAMTFVKNPNLFFKNKNYLNKINKENIKKIEDFDLHSHQEE